MAAPTDSYGALVYSHTPIAYWRFDGDGVDVMGGTSMTLTGGAAATGTSLVSTYSGAKSLTCDGTNDYASVPDEAKFDLTYNLTLEAWFNAVTLTGNGGIVGKFDWGIGFSDTTLRIFSWFGGWLFYNWSSALSTSTLYHAVGTYDGANVRLYLNGVLDSTTARTSTFNVNAKPLEVGSWDTSADWFDGRIDEVAVYDRALSAAEIAQHYAAGLANNLTLPPRSRLNYGALLQV